MELLEGSDEQAHLSDILYLKSINFNPTRKRVGTSILASGPNCLLSFFAIKTIDGLGLLVWVCSSQSVGTLGARVVSDWHPKLPVVPFNYWRLCHFASPSAFGE